LKANECKHKIASYDMPCGMYELSTFLQREKTKELIYLKERKTRRDKRGEM